MTNSSKSSWMSKLSTTEKGVLKCLYDNPGAAFGCVDLVNILVPESQTRDNALLPDAAWLQAIEQAHSEILFATETLIAAKLAKGTPRPHREGITYIQLALTQKGLEVAIKLQRMPSPSGA